MLRRPIVSHPAPPDRLVMRTWASAPIGSNTRTGHKTSSHRWPMHGIRRAVVGPGLLSRHAPRRRRGRFAPRQRPAFVACAHPLVRLGTPDGGWDGHELSPDLPLPGCERETHPTLPRPRSSGCAAVTPAATQVTLYRPVLHTCLSLRSPNRVHAPAQPDECLLLVGETVPASADQVSRHRGEGLASGTPFPPSYLDPSRSVGEGNSVTAVGQAAYESRSLPALPLSLPTPVRPTEYVSIHNSSPPPA